MKLKTAIEYWDKIYPMDKSDSWITEWYDNYIQFLKQPLQLGLFIPCDKEGKPLKKPIKEDMTYYQRIEEYQQACDRVLFEGFEIRYETDGFYRFWNDNIDIEFAKNEFWTSIGKIKTINDLSGKVDLVEKVAEQFKY